MAKTHDKNETTLSSSYVRPSVRLSVLHFAAFVRQTNTDNVGKRQRDKDVKKANVSWHIGEVIRFMGNLRRNFRLIVIAVCRTMRSVVPQIPIPICGSKRKL